MPENDTPAIPAIDITSVEWSATMQRDCPWCGEALVMGKLVAIDRPMITCMNCEFWEWCENDG
jgi:hypothetical protein